VLADCIHPDPRRHLGRLVLNNKPARPRFRRRQAGGGKKGLLRQAGAKSNRVGRLARGPPCLDGMSPPLCPKRRDPVSTPCRRDWPHMHCASYRSVLVPIVRVDVARCREFFTARPGAARNIRCSMRALWEIRRIYRAIWRDVVCPVSAGSAGRPGSRHWQASGLGRRQAQEAHQDGRTATFERPGGLRGCNSARKCMGGC
jgi:hypothetical protein